MKQYKYDYKYRHRETYKGVQIDIKAKALRELTKKIEIKKNEIDSGSVDPSISFKDYSLKWANAYKKNTVSLSWFNEILRIINKQSEAIGNKPISCISSMEVQEYLNTLSNNSNSYIKKEYDILNQIFRRAYKDRVISFPLDFEKPVGKKAMSGRSLTNYEKEVLLEVLQDHRGELFCKLMLFCGLRGQEAAVLQWKDIDFKRNVVIIDKALKRDGAVGAPKSTAGVREVPIPISFISTLKKHKGEPFSLVCTTSTGGMYTESNRKNLVKNIKREMNIKMGCRVVRNQLIPPLPLQDFKMHYLRHTYCTDLEKAGVPINIAKVLMGHSSIEVTAGIYTHADYQTIEIARQLIDAR